MKRNPIIAALLSVLIPGLGHIYSGHTNKGIKLLFAAILIGSLNIIALLLIAITNLETDGNTQNTVWVYWIPRIVHDVLAAWSIVFWSLIPIDAVRSIKKGE